MSTYRLSISGIVQGVGFRPFVYRLANECRLTGYVANTSTGVTILIQGEKIDLEKFLEHVRIDAPAHSRIDELSTQTITEGEMFQQFSIRDSQSESEKTARISPDLDVCDDCLKELFDRTNRRYLYPFTNCTHCGPRFTITLDVPYDRKLTTMQDFVMCPDCQREYENPVNRRFHAQPNACPVCGPRVRLFSNDAAIELIGGDSSQNEAIFQTLSRIYSDGKIVAVKGIGGFHLSCNAENEPAVAALRARKFREDKPFAVMFPNLAMIEEYCEISDAERALLQQVTHPIVLLRKKVGRQISASVAPMNHFLGAMLPYSPLHHLIFHFYKKPLVMTSGNVSDEPIAFTNDDAIARLSSIADYFLTHDRRIHTRCDDSVVRIWDEREYPIRKARGYSPEQISLDWKFDQPVLACGAEQKNTFALAKNNHIFLSQHIGDMENIEVLRSFESGIQHYQKVFNIEPEIVAYDFHPDYLSTRFAFDHPAATISGKPIRKVGVQHHHAHAVSCMAENGVRRALAIVLDGTGFGIDGTIWGGEILLAEFDGFRRLAHFATVGMPGGNSAIRNPWQMAVGYLHRVFGNRFVEFGLPFLKTVKPDDLKIILKAVENQINTPSTSSCGRLFDGVAAVAGIRNHVHYEGQAAIEFEQTITDENVDGYPFGIETQNDMIILDWKEVIKSVVGDVLNGMNPGTISVKFHCGLAIVLSEATEKARRSTGVNDVVLSGGVFMNIHLLTMLSDLLKENGFRVWTHRHVPPNDGGISVGQAVIASAVVKKERSMEN
ncbi:MAG: carbamoyltransferase HypF [Candidatus Neomarinimicrobiota bacterium]